MADRTNPDRGTQKPPSQKGGSKGSDNPFAGTKPPKYTPPVTGAENKYLAWAKQHGFDRKTAGNIWYWSHQKISAVDPYYYSAVLLAESGGKHIDPNTGKGTDSGQAIGIGQVAKSWIGQPIPWDKTHVFTADSNERTGLYAYGVNLRESAYLLSQAVALHGYDKAYTDGYNPKDPHRQEAWAAIQNTLKSRPAGLPPLAPTEGPANATTNAGKAAYPVFKDPFVAGVDRKGKFVTTGDPNKALQYDGLPLTRSSFKSLQDGLSSYYVSYTGRRPSPHQIQNFLQKGWSTYTLTSLLSQSGSFKNSPIYKQNAPQLNAAVKEFLPAGQRVPDEIMRQAILHNWDATTVAAKVRQLPAYLQSNNFKGNVASLINVHQSIMGTPDDSSLIAIKDAALQGWSVDQYAAWLRSQPTYTQSTEYQKNSLSFLDALGLITGKQAVLKPGVTGPGGVAPQTDPLKADKRVPGTPSAGTGQTLSNLGATLNG